MDSKLNMHWYIMCNTKSVNCFVLKCNIRSNTQNYTFFAEGSHSIFCECNYSILYKCNDKCNSPSMRRFHFVAMIRRETMCRLVQWKVKQPKHGPRNSLQLYGLGFFFNEKLFHWFSQTANHNTVEVGRFKISPLAYLVMIQQQVYCIFDVSLKIN